MRKILIDLLLIAAAMTLVCTTADARRHGAQDRSQRISREELILVQAAHIADRLGLDKKTTERFTETYCSFQQEIWNLGPRPGRLSPDAGEEETGEYLRSRFAQSRRILDLREKYYHLYSEFLTQKQIQQIYRIEREMMDRLSGRGKDNAAHGPEQKPAYAPGKRQ